MAELDSGTEPQDDLPGADEPQTEADPGLQTDDPPQDPPADPLLDRDGRGAEDPNDPNYKKWQAAYTQSRQHDRARYGKVEAEHKQFGEVLRNFYQSDEYALQVLRQRFPHLAQRLSLDGTPQGQPQGTPRGASTSSPLVQALEAELGSDLAFLAPRLGPVLERAIQSGLEAAMTPFQQRSQQQQEAIRRREADRVHVEMDTEYPGWESRYGSKMDEIEAFLASGELTHPVYGSRKALLYKLANPDLARIDLARQTTSAGRNRLTTGRSGAPSQPNSDEHVRTAKTNAEAFQLAAHAALRELGQRG